MINIVKTIFVHNYCIVDGLLVLEYLALVICVTANRDHREFEQIVIVSSANPSLGLTVTVLGHAAPKRTYSTVWTESNAC
jgi:hypothetical protein